MVVFYNMDESEVKNYSHFHLCIEIKERNLSLLLFDTETNKPVAIEHIEIESEDEFETALANSEIGSKTTPETVSCAVINSQFTLIPSAIFVKEEIKTYLSLAIPKEELRGNLLADKHQQNECFSCFQISEVVENALKNKFPGVVIKHVSSVLGDSLKDGFHVNFSTSSHFEITVIQQGKLLFFNRFHFENKDESLYYLSLVVEKLALPIQETRLSVSGNVDKNGETISFWKQFIPQENITFNEIEASQLNAVSTHQYFTLHKQYQCV